MWAISSRRPIFATPFGQTRPPVELSATPPCPRTNHRGLFGAADWDLPPALLQRQSQRELQRAVMELQRSGFSEDEIHAHENDLRQNSQAATARALKEHFIFERIAEEEEIDAGEENYEAEIRLIAEQSGESPRRVRARLEKSGWMDVLRNQIVERKVIERILDHAKFKEVPYEFRRTEEEALDQRRAAASTPTFPKPSTTKREEVPEARGQRESEEERQRDGGLHDGP